MALDFAKMSPGEYFTTEGSNDLYYDVMEFVNLEYINGEIYLKYIQKQNSFCIKINSEMSFKIDSTKRKELRLLTDEEKSRWL